MARRILTVFVFACALSAAAPVRADDAAQARFHDELAREHYAHGRYEDALREFFLEQRLAPNPRIVFNIALCLDRLHRNEDAFLFYAEYAASDDVDATRRAHVASALSRLEPTLARVRIESDPEGAWVYVDDHDHGSWGQTPRLLALSPGEHRVMVERDGYAPAEATLTLERGVESRLDLTLPLIEGSLRVVSPGAGRAEVRDEMGTIRADGPTPLEATLPPGVYAVEVIGEGHRPFRDVVRVSRDTLHEIVAVLEALPAPTGEITVTSNVPGAVVELDGEAVGFAPTILHDVSVAEHRVSVHAEGLEPFDETVSVEPDVRSWLTVSLVAPAETSRSETTWVIGGVGVAGVVLWGALLGISIDNHSRFDALYGRAPTDALRSSGETIDVAADVTLALSLTALVTAVVLYFATEHTEMRESTGALSRGER